MPDANGFELTSAPNAEWVFTDAATSDGGTVSGSSFPLNGAFELNDGGGMELNGGTGFTGNTAPSNGTVLTGIAEFGFITGTAANDGTEFGGTNVLKAGTGFWGNTAVRGGYELGGGIRFKGGNVGKRFGGNAGVFAGKTVASGGRGV